MNRGRCCALSRLCCAAALRDVLEPAIADLSTIPNGLLDIARSGSRSRRAGA